MKLFIENNTNCHYEIIESIINKYKFILPIKDISENKIEICLFIKNNPDYKKYLSNKYKNIKFNKIQDYDYYINCTFYPKDLNKNFIANSNNHFYISHRVNNKLKQFQNIFFLTPLSKKRYFYADILPFQNEKIRNKIPIYIIQGNISLKRRDFHLLYKILSKKYKHKFKIKIIGKGNFSRYLLKKFKNILIFKKNLNFIDYHKQFLDGYCILPLTNKKKTPQYYSTTLTSSINYIKGYNLKCIIDKNLQNIYKLKNAFVFNNINNIQRIFERSLNYFYKRNN